ncbi:MAG: HAD hydrolase-like protein [Bacteroidales bacterium]|nr:HAD hydrolase-like protein [Bacteroidales bacterium]
MNQKNKNTIIFDLDGTLLDTTEGIVESVRYTIGQMKLPELSDAQLLSFIGPPVQISFVNHYGLSEEEAQRISTIFRTYYKEKALLKAKPYEGIFELLKQLKDAGKRLAVATYKREDYALMILKHFGFDRYFDVMRGADDKNQLKKVDIVNLCISEMNGLKDNAVLVGDTLHDAIGAQEAGVDFLGVTYGFGFTSREDVDKYPNIGCAKKVNEIFSLIV